MWTHTSSSSIFLDSRNNALAMYFIAGANSEDYSMNLFQYIICCIIASILPPFTWIYVLIDWILGGCRIPSFTLEDIAICECSDDDMDFEDLIVLQQMLDDFEDKNRT